MKAVLVFLQPQPTGMCTGIFCSNGGAMATTNNPSSALSKHIDMKFQFIQGLVRTGDIRIIVVGMEGQHADILTKRYCSIRRFDTPRCANESNLTCDMARMV